VTALEDASLSVDAGEFVCVIGPSGCGKTTLLKILAGLIAPTSGDVRLDDVPLDGHPPVALVFQGDGLLPWMSAVDNASFGLRMRGVPKAARRRRAADQLRQMGLGAFLDSFPHELSAGMRQRVNLARALLVEPRVLLMDEPFAALDALVKLALQQDLVDTWAARRSAVLFVTHDIDEAVRLGDRILVMTGGRGRPGRIVEELRVPLARPRDLVADATPAGIDLRRHIGALLEGDVRRPLSPALVS
jgi:NitT/TauT family transport system ATP-binding protein